MLETITALFASFVGSGLLFAIGETVRNWLASFEGPDADEL